MKDYKLKENSSDKPFAFSFKQLKGILVYFHQKQTWLVLAILSILGSALSSVSIPYFITIAIDEAIPARDLDFLAFLVTIVASLALISLTLGFVQAYVLGRLSQGFLFSLRSRLFEKLQEMPQAFFTQNQTGDLLSRLNNDSDKMAQFFSSGVNRWFSNVFTLMGILVFMALLSATLTGGLLLVVLLCLWLTKRLTRLSRSLSRDSLASLSSFSAIVSENLHAFKAVILLSRREEWIRMLGEANAKNAQANFRSAAVSGLFSFIYTVLGNFTQVIVLLIGLIIFSQGYSSLGVLIGFLTYTQRFYAALGQLGTVWGEAQMAMAAWERLTILLNLQTHLKVLPPTCERDPAQPILELKDVRFGYESVEPILENLSLRFERGKTYAIVGPTGGGKSTTVALMARLIDPWKGSILIEGQDLKTLSAREISQRIGVILQDPFLFEGTLAQNLRYGNKGLEDKSDEALEKELEELGLAGIIEALGSDLSRKFSEGKSSLSLGQKQLISFLRAILRRPAVLILDEATANIDTVTEHKLEEVLKTLEGGTTQIIIAHRLATVQRADEVIFINRHYVRSGLSYGEAVELVQDTKLGS